MNKPKKIPISVLVVMYNPCGQFLLIERADKAGYWQSVTGSLDAWDEPPIDAAVRELQEETGFIAKPDSSQGLLELSHAELLQSHVLRPWPHSLQYEIFEHWRHRYGEDVTHNTEHWFFVCLPEGESPQLAPGEHVRFEWLSPQVAAERCFSPNNAQAIRALATRLVEGKKAEGK